MGYDIKRSGERIRQLRIQNGYTQEKLAGVLNIDQSYYGRIETSKRMFCGYFIQLSNLFGVSLDYLVLGKSDSRSSRGVAVDQLKFDIENLVNHLERFKNFL